MSDYAIKLNFKGYIRELRTLLIFDRKIFYIIDISNIKIIIYF